MNTLPSGVLAPTEVFDAAALTRWLREHRDALESLRAVRARSVEDEVADDRVLLRLLYDAGWSRFGWPREAGGLGGDETCRAQLYDALARFGVALPEAFVLLETLGPVLVRYSPELATRHLPAYLRGDELWGQGFSEPEAGSDLASVRTTGRVGADSLVLDGQKVWTTLGQCAQWAMVLCRTDPEAARHRGLSMVWVDLGQPGAEVRPIRAANGRNEFAEMFFTDVRVPLTNVIGGLGQGWAVAMYLLQFERGMYAWGRQAALHRSLRLGLARNTSPSAAGRAAVATAFTTLCALRARSAATVRRLAAGETLGPEASVDKVLLSRAEQQTQQALRLLAPDGFVAGDDDADVALRADWFYSRATSIFGGAVEVQRSIVAEHILRLPRESRRG